MALWRVLDLYERLGYASPFKHPPQTKQRKKTKLKSARKRAFAAEPLGESPAYTVAPCLDFYRYVFRYVTFGSFAITSGLTVPIYSPSSQQLNLSERMNFFSFSLRKLPRSKTRRICATEEILKWNLLRIM